MRSLFALIGCLVCLSVMAQTPRPTVSVLFFPAEPWYIRDLEGRYAGISIEQARHLVEEAGMQAEFVDLPWSRALDYMKDGRLDMMLNLSRTPEREAFIHFLGVMAYERTVVAVHEDHADLPLKTLDDLARGDLKWGIRQDFFYSEAFNRRLAEDASFRAHFEAHTKSALNMEKARAKRLDSLLADAVILRWALANATTPYPLLVREVPFFPAQPIFIGVSRRLPVEQLDRLQAAFDKLQRQHVFEFIVKAWTTQGQRAPRPLPTSP